jgi:hypothetical protein
LREVSDNIFQDLMKLVNSRNDAIHTKKYEEKWNNIKSVVERVFGDLKRLYVEAQNTTLNKWLNKIVKSMEDVEVKRKDKLISNSPYYVNISTVIPQAVKVGLDTSWITQVLVKFEKPVFNALKMKEPEEGKLV